MRIHLPLWRGSCLAVVALCLLGPLACLQANDTVDGEAAEPLRLWTDATGKYQVRAALVDSDSGQVQLRKPDGKIVPVPIDKLSLADQQYVNLPADLTIWPNRESHRNSDPWLVEHHDQIRTMKPRLLILNFSNNRDMEWIRQRTEETIAALAESTRYHGFSDPQAPAFLQYEVARYIDLRDQPPGPGRENRNSRRYPRGDRPGTTRYAPFYSDELAKAYGFPDPAKPGRFLSLHALIEAGLVHELWFFGIHDDEIAAFESVEFKQYYDQEGKAIDDRHGPAGNGHPDDMPWSGRSFRITWFNTDRGLGCGMENFGHALEGMANYDTIPYFKKYFDEFAEFDLNKRYAGFPVDRLYAIRMGTADKVEYPDATTLALQLDGKAYTIHDYVAMGGNVHFPPGARGHYDLSSPFIVKTVMENYRLRNGPNGQDLPHDFDPARFRQYEKLAPDCMGQWLVYWRQCMPGYGNRCVDDAGQPMKNWWVYLFY